MSRVMSEIGKYPFGNILTAFAYIHNCVINSL